MGAGQVASLRQVHLHEEIETPGSIFMIRSHIDRLKEGQ
jgi:hypothetical protein